MARNINLSPPPSPPPPSDTYPLPQSEHRATGLTHRNEEETDAGSSTPIRIQVFNPSVWITAYGDASGTKLCVTVMELPVTDALVAV